MTITTAASPSPFVSPVAGGRLTIVTAADQAYGRCLYQFLRSAERRGLNARHDIVAYDLGLDAQFLQHLQARFPWCEFRRFRFENYPPHVGAHLRAHAWKPFVVEEALQAARGLLLWLDSATLFHGALDEVEAAIRRHGVYALRGQSALGVHCDADILDALSVPARTRVRPERVSGALGLDPGNAAARKLAANWCALHRTPEYVRTATATHKSDQALLSIAMFAMEDAGELTLGDDEIDVSSRRPVRWMSSRNKVPAWLPLWLDPAARGYYAIYKTVDRADLGWRHRITSLVNGLSRWRKEHFTVFVASAATRKTIAVKAPSLSYYADPFVWRHRERTYLVCEQFHYLQHKGELCCIPLDAELRPGAPQRMLAHERHASFPYLFEDSATLYLVPELRAEGIHLYRCDDFPAQWTHLRTLVPGVDAADTVVFRHGGLWWLITSLRTQPDGNGRYLAIFFADDLLGGRWQPHPVNAQRLYGQLPFSSGRNAGAVISSGDRLLRPSQHNPHYYGEAVRWMEIETLTPTEFRESALGGTHPFAQFAARNAMHHLTVHDGLIAWDVRDRVDGAFRPAARQFAAAGLDRDIADAALSLS
jgi:hypothetical protein